MLRTRRRNDSQRGQLSWLLTYSDMVTLCLTFFVLLYSFSTLDAIKWKTVVTSVQGALGPLDGGTSIIEGPPVGGAHSPGYSEEEKTEQGLDQERIQQLLMYQEENKRLEQLQSELNEYLSEKGLNASVAVELEERGLVLRFQDSVLFQRSRADLLEQSRLVLHEVANILKEIDNPIRVEGHTDDLPINTERFPSNWELSTSRATNVLRFLMQEGIPGKQLSAVGYGEFHPLVPNTNEENRQKNRRVDVVIIRESLRVNEPN